jgi:hypothetical protein
MPYPLPLPESDALIGVALLRQKTALSLSAAPLPLVGTLGGLMAGQAVGEMATPALVNGIGAGPGAVHDQLVEAGHPVPANLQAILDSRAASLAHTGELLGAAGGAIAGNLGGQYANSLIGQRNRAPAY